MQRVSRVIIIAFALLATSVFFGVPAPLYAQIAAGGMPTIETQTFNHLEKRLGDALVAQDRVTLESLLANDFEVRTARSGGELTLRDEWLDAAVSNYKRRSYQVRSLAVRSFGRTAVVSFLYSQQASFSGNDLSGDFFIVDVWQKVGKDWKIVARYSAGPGAVPKPPADLKTKE